MRGCRDSRSVLRMEAPLEASESESNPPPTNPIGGSNPFLNKHYSLEGSVSFQNLRSQENRPGRKRRENRDMLFDTLRLIGVDGHGWRVEFLDALGNVVLVSVAAYATFDEARAALRNF